VTELDSINAIEDKNHCLSLIEQSVRTLQASPLYAYRIKSGYKPVIGEGDPDAEILMVGEAPGEKEALSGRPFVGLAGEVLDQLLQKINLNRKDVYITNIVKDRPPNNRDPRAAEIKCYAPFLMAQIEIIQPKVIVTLGRFALNFFLKQLSLPEYGRTIGDLHGQVLVAQTKDSTIEFLPLYHPAAIFYNRSLEKVLHQDIQVLSRYV
jgi:uracil-DNA glycosylase